MFVAGEQRNQKRGYKPAVTETTKLHFPDATEGFAAKQPEYPKKYPLQ